jgi:hypothetical protein
LNEEVDSQEENGFSRRRVVAGVAWSLPVIATAIAAPAAAASPGTVSITAAFDGEQSPLTIAELTAPGQGHTATGPTAFHVKNGGSQSTSITGSIRIAPNPAASGDPGVGVQSLTNATMSSAVLDANNVFTATFTIANLASNGTASVPIQFYYKGKKTQQRNFQMTITVTYPAVGVPFSTAISLT